MLSTLRYVCNADGLYRIIYGYFEIAAKEGDLAGMKGMIMG